MKKTSSRKKIVCGAIAGILVLGVVGGIFGYNYAKAYFQTVDDYMSKDIEAELGSAENPFTILEIVSDESMGIMGYYLPGYEPVTPSQAGYDYNAAGTSIYRNLVNGGAMKLLNTTEYGIPTSGEGWTMKLGYAYDVFDDAKGIIGKEQIKTLETNTISANGAPVYIEEGYYIRVEAGKGHYNLNPSTHMFEKVDNGFEYLYSGATTDTTVNGAVAALKNVGYTGTAGGNFDWVKTGYYITTTNNNAVYNNNHWGEDIYNKLSISKSSTAYVDGVRGAGNDYSSNMTAYTDYTQISGWNDDWLDLIKKIYDGDVATAEDFDAIAELDAFVAANVNFEPGVAGYAIKSGAVASMPTDTTTQPLGNNPAGYAGNVSIDDIVENSGRYNCKNEDFFKKYIYLYNLCRPNNKLATTIDTAAYFGVYSTGYNYFSFTGNSTPYLDLDTYAVNEECLDGSVERFHSLRVDPGQDVVGVKYYYYENTNALIDRIFGEEQNPNDVIYQYILVTTGELRAACAANGNKLPEKYKTLIDYADFISIPGDYACDRYDEYAGKYYRFHPEVTKKNAADLKMNKWNGSSYDNDLPADAVYEIFLRQAGALNIDGLRPAGVMFNNLNQTGELREGNVKSNWNYMKLFVLLMENSPHDLYINHVETANRIYVDYSTGNLMAKPVYREDRSLSTLWYDVKNWWKQMFNPYSADVNQRAYGGGQIVSGSALTIDGGLDFANNFTHGSVMGSESWRIQDIVNSTYIDDEYKAGNQFSALTVFQYLIGANDNYKEHISVLEIQNDDANFISGAKMTGATTFVYDEPDPRGWVNHINVTDRADRYYKGYPLTRQEEEFYEAYLAKVLPWFTGTSIKYPSGITLADKKHMRFEKNYTITRMTVAEFNASTVDICGAYDLIIIGSGISETNGSDLADKKYNEIESFMHMGAVIFDSGNTANMSIFNNKPYVKRLLNVANANNSGGFNYKTVTPAFNYSKITPYSDQLKALTNAVAMYKCQVIMNSAPDEYVSYTDANGLYTGAQYNGSTLVYTFKFKGAKNTNYKCQLFIDHDGVDSRKIVHACDGVFDGTIKLRNSLSLNGVTVDTGSEAIPISISGQLTPDGSLIRNKTYTVTCDVSQYNLNGYLPWKLEIYNTANDNIRTTVTGNTCVTNGTKTTIRVLQMCPTQDMHDVPSGQMINMATTGLGTSHWGSSIDVGAGEHFKKYMDAVNNNSDCEISIRYKSNADWMKEFNNPEKDATAWIDELTNYDIVVLGFSQSLQKSGNAIFNEGIDNFINSGKGIIYGNNYLNTATPTDRTRAGQANRQGGGENKHRVLLTNETKITNYPYNLVKKDGSTYSSLYAQCINLQDYNLNLNSIRQGDVVISYAFSDTNGVREQANIPNGDAKGLYYIYNTDNITFMALGCNTQYGNNVSDDEVKLFINALYGAYRKIPDTPYLVVTNEDFYPNNTKAALSTGYIELIGDTAGVDVEVGLKAIYDLNEIDYQKWEVTFLDKGDTSSTSAFSTEKGCVSVRDGGRTATIVRDVPFSFTASYDRAIQMKGNYFVRLMTTYNRKGYTVEVPYIQKIQLLPMAMFDLY